MNKDSTAIVKLLAQLLFNAHKDEQTESETQSECFVSCIGYYLSAFISGGI
jgi:hypothetical protein